MMMYWLIICLPLSVAVGVFASKKGRNGYGFFWLSIFLSPFIGFLFALIADTDQQSLDKDKLFEGDHKKCGFCAEIIKIEANTCKFCHNEQPPNLPEGQDVD